MRQPYSDVAASAPAQDEVCDESGPSLMARSQASTGVTVDRVIRRLLYEIEERQEGDEQPPIDPSD